MKKEFKEIVNTNNIPAGQEYRSAKRFTVDVNNETLPFSTMELSFTSATRNDTGFYIIIDGKSMDYRESCTYAARDKRWVYWLDMVRSRFGMLDNLELFRELMSMGLEKHFETATNFCEMFYGGDAYNNQNYLTHDGGLGVEYAIVINNNREITGN